VADLVSDIIEDEGLDLLVTVVHGRKGLERVVLGIGGEELLRARCIVSRY